MVSVRVRQQKTDVAKFVNGEQPGRAVVRVRERSNHRQHIPTNPDNEIADAISRIFTNADRTFFKPIRLQMGAAKLSSPYAQHEWVYAAIRAKATAISQVPLQVLRGDATNPEENSKPVEATNDWVRFFAKPNPLLTGSQFKEAIEVFLELHGEAFAINTTKDGLEWMRGLKAPNSAWLVNPTNMVHVVSEQSGELLGWEYTPPGGGQPIPYSTDEVTHFKLFNPDNPYRGLSPISPILQGLRTDFKAGVFDEALLDNSGSPGGVLTSDIDLHPDQIRDIRTQWNKRHLGSRKAGHTAILGGGMKYQENNFTAKDMQFLEKRSWTRDGVLACIGTPPLAIGLEDQVNRATAQVVRRMWWTDKLLPILGYIADVFNGHYFDPSMGVQRTVTGRGLFVQFDTSGVEALREDFGEQLDHAAKLKGLGYAANEINARLNLGMPEVTWGNERLEAPTQVPVGLLYSQPGVFVQSGNQDAQSADDEAKGLQASLEAIVVVRKMPRGLARRKRLSRIIKQRFFEPSEDRIHKALKKIYRQLKNAAVAEGTKAVNEATQAALVFTGKTPLVKVEEAIGKLRPADVDRILGIQKDWDKVTADEIDAPLNRVMNDALGQIGGELGGFEVVSPTNKTFTRLHARRIASMVKVNKKVRRDLRSSILKAISNGGINDVGGVLKELRSKFDQLSEGRAIRIARTETGILGNTTRFEAMKMEGIEKHEWINAGDEFVRPDENASADSGDHRKVDGQVVEIGKEFSNGLKHPHQAGKPAKEIINCRCVTAPVVDI